MTIADTVAPLGQVADLRATPDRKLIRAGLLMLLFMTTAFAAATWNTVQDLTTQVKAVPVVLFVVVCVLVAQLYVKVGEITVVRQNLAASIDCGTQPLSPALHAQGGASPQYISQLSQVSLETRNEIWRYWDNNGTGRRRVEYISDTYGIAAHVVQHLLEGYDVKWREQLATLYRDNPRNEYMAHIGIEEHQVAEDAFRLGSGLPIYPVVGVWLCSDCRNRPCRCGAGTPKDRSLDRA